MSNQVTEWYFMDNKILDLIDLAINDGQITDRQKEIIYRRAKELNIDETEVEIIIDSKLASTQTKNKTNSHKVYSIASQIPNEGMPIKRRLCRDTDKGMISGVCAGIAKYFNCSTGIVRTVFFLGFVITCHLYLILAIVLPKEEDISI